MPYVNPLSWYFAINGEPAPWGGFLAMPYVCGQFDHWLESMKAFDEPVNPILPRRLCGKVLHMMDYPDAMLIPRHWHHGDMTRKD